MFTSKGFDATIEANLACLLKKLNLKKTKSGAIEVNSEAKAVATGTGAAAGAAAGTGPGPGANSRLNEYIQTTSNYSIDSIDITFYNSQDGFSKYVVKPTLDKLIDKANNKSIQYLMEVGSKLIASKDTAEAKTAEAAAQAEAAQAEAAYLQQLLKNTNDDNQTGAKSFYGAHDKVQYHNYEHAKFVSENAKQFAKTYFPYDTNLALKAEIAGLWHDAGHQGYKTLASTKKYLMSDASRNNIAIDYYNKADFKTLEDVHAQLFMDFAKPIQGEAKKKNTR